MVNLPCGIARRLSDEAPSPGRQVAQAVQYIPSPPRKRGPTYPNGYAMLRDMQPCVYILASRRHGTLYVGVTGDLRRRVWEHKIDAVEGFTKRYRVHALVYAELHDTMADAILREKRIKKWRRAWKVELIERDNPDWRDLYAEFGAR